MIEIKSECGHYAGYVDGVFVSNGDTYRECEKECEEYISEHKKEEG